MRRLLLLAAVLGLPVPATAQPEERNSVIVSYADLNLAVPTGQKALQYRIFSAARRLCEVAYPRGSVFLLEFQGCERESIARAQPAYQAAVAAAQQGRAPMLAAGALVISDR